jgi:coronin-1B/1C/6
MAKDKMLRVVDARAGSVVGEAKSHQGSKGGRVAWLSRINRILTVGFSKTNAREAALLDPRNLTTPVAVLPAIDAQPSTSTLIPLVDDELGVVFLAGKGEGSIRVLEATESALVLATEFKNKDPQSSAVLLPKTVVDTSKCEIDRVLRLIEAKHLVVPVRFEVPRQAGAQVFQEDLYPPTFDGQPSCSAADFFAGSCRSRNVRPFPRK